MCWRRWASMPEASLYGLHVVVTRPAHQAVHFCRQLQQAGAVPIAFPVIAVEACTDSVAVLTALAGLDTYDTVIFISSNAVKYGLALLDVGQQTVLRGKQIGAIGKQTAASLSQAGFHPAFVPENGFTSEDFLALDAMQQLTGRRVLVVRGEGGRELLAKSLCRRGALVDYADVYRRVRPKNDADLLKHHHERQQLDIIAITSGEGLLNLLALLDYPEWIKAVPLLVGSQRMAVTARQAGFSGAIAMADNPGDEAMLVALRHWYRKSLDDRQSRTSNRESNS